METRQINFISIDPISTLVQNWLNTLAMHDPLDVVHLYAPDGILLGTIAENIKVGRDEIRSLFKDRYEPFQPSEDTIKFFKR